MSEGPYYFRNGDIWYRSSSQDHHVCDGSGMLGVAFDAEEGVLFKHGELSRVEAWAETNRRKLANSPMPSLADAITVVGFPPVAETLAELNACVEISGRISRFVGFLKELGEQHPELMDRPIYPAPDPRS